MNEREKFLFDLRGYLRVENFLTPEEVQVLNKAVDANHDKYTEDSKMYGLGMDGEYNRRSMTGMLTWERPWCQPFRDLIAHRKLIPYLNALFGRGWRMDHEPFLLVSRKGTGGHGLHGATSRHFDGTQYYAYANGEMRVGLIVCQFQLADINPGDGGIAVIPGSHKANFLCPEDIMLYDANQEVVYNVESKAGNLVIFMEATIHGALPWQGNHERRSLLYRYCPKSMHTSGGIYQASMPTWVDELTEAQQAALEPPYIYNRPLIEDDGATLVQPGEDPEPHRPRGKAEMSSNK